MPLILKLLLTIFYSRARNFREVSESLVVANISRANQSFSYGRFNNTDLDKDRSRTLVVANKSWFTAYDFVTSGNHWAPKTTTETQTNQLDT